MSNSISNITSCDFEKLFIQVYKNEYGFELINREVLVDDIRIRAIGHSTGTGGHNSDPSHIPPPPSTYTNIATSTTNNSNISKGHNSDPTLSIPPPIPSEYVSVYYEHIGRYNTPIYNYTDLNPNFSTLGPCIIIQNITTIIIEPNCHVYITNYGDIEINILYNIKHILSTTIYDTIYLSIFSHRFMGIAEQVCITLVYIQYILVYILYILVYVYVYILVYIGSY